MLICKCCFYVVWCCRLSYYDAPVVGLHEELRFPVDCLIVNEYMEQRRCKYTSLDETASLSDGIARHLRHFDEFVFISDLADQTFSIFAKQIMLKIMSEMQKRHFISLELTRINLYQSRNSGVFFIEHSVQGNIS